MSITYKLITSNNPLYLKLIRLRRERIWIPLNILTPLYFEEEESNSLFYVAFEKPRQVLGGMALTPEPNNKWIRFRQLTVSKEHESQGIGTQLIRQGIQYAKENHYNRIALYAFENVVPYFEKNGFKTYGGWYAHVNKMRSILMLMDL